MNYVSLTLNEPYRITKSSNPTTGYTWHFAASEGLQINDEYKTSCNKPGCGGNATWVVTPKKEGVLMLTLFNTRSWDAQDHPSIENYLFYVTKHAIMEVYLLKGKIEGINYDGKSYSALWQPIHGEKQYETKLKFEVPFKLNGSVILLKKDNEYFFLHKPQGSDMMNTLYRQNGEEVGVPSGGLSGKGDGKTSLKGYVHVDEIIFNQYL